MRIDLKDVLDLDEVSRAILEEYRRKRAFAPAAYVEAKAAALGDYCKNNGIDSAVLTVLSWLVSPRKSPIGTVLGFTWSPSLQPVVRV